MSVLELREEEVRTFGWTENRICRALWPRRDRAPLQDRAELALLGFPVGVRLP